MGRPSQNNGNNTDGYKVKTMYDLLIEGIMKPSVSPSLSDVLKRDMNAPIIDSSKFPTPTVEASYTKTNLSVTEHIPAPDPNTHVVKTDFDYKFEKYNESVFNQYFSLKSKIKRDGYLEIKLSGQYIKVTNPLYYLVFLQNDFFVEKESNNEISNEIFHTTLTTAYSEGVEYFNNHFIKCLNSISRNAINDILFNLQSKEIRLEKNRKGRLFGWQSISHYNPIEMSVNVADYFGYYFGIHSSCIDFMKSYPSSFEKFKGYNSNDPQIIWDLEVNATSKPNTKPVFDPDIIDPLVEKMRTSFDENNLKKFREILATGDDVPGKIIYQSTAISLGCVFRSLIKAHTQSKGYHQPKIINKVNQKQLEKWLSRNFLTIENASANPSEVRSKYMSDIISSDKQNPCDKPLFDVRYDQENKKYLIVSNKVKESQ